ncbi:hypothetical protein pdam_00002904 [Pocillopora damicornis]|uniref:Uncharacterized protein n=1 Tax=Pocillopora damicornis TaxID=46731 RepID=A0A3M6U8S1_POCDA|nr:hypothetical protein pdam_00002904 [Pocillopora damicornis]
MGDSSDKFHNPKQVTKPSYLLRNSCSILICYERFGFFDEIIPIQNLVKTMKDVMAMKAAMTMKAVFRRSKLDQKKTSFACYPQNSLRRREERDVLELGWLPSLESAQLNILKLERRALSNASLPE